MQILTTPNPRLNWMECIESGWRRHIRDEAGNIAIASSTTNALPDVRLKLLPQLQPRSDQKLLYAHHESIDVGRLGRAELTVWGELKFLRGIETIRGYCSSVIPIRELQVKLDGLLLFKGPCAESHFRMEKSRPEIRKWVFNVWIDFLGLRLAGTKSS